MSRQTRAIAARALLVLLDGPVTCYGFADLVGLAGGDRYARARAWLKDFHEAGLIEPIGERENPSGSRKGTHPVYQLKRPT